jgi:hypothetical protein
MVPAPHLEDDGPLSTGVAATRVPLARAPELEPEPEPEPNMTIRMRFLLFLAG